MNGKSNIHSTYQSSLNNSDNDNNDNNNQLSCLTNLSSPDSSEEFVYSRSSDIGSTVQSSLLTHNEKPQRLEQNISQYDPNEPLPSDDSNKCLEESSQSLSEYSPNVEEDQREKDAISSGTSILADDKINSNSGTDNNDNSQFRKSDLPPSTFKFRTSTAEEAVEKHLQNLLKDQNIRSSQSDLSSVTDDDLKSGILQNDSKDSKYNSDSSGTALPKYQKFSYFETDDGYFVQVGENQLRDCSDEPIHIPGAIQSYGCLLVVEENDIDIIVRQASENSKNIIGLSPKELFHLNCFTEILEQHESATKLRDVLFEFGEAEKNLEKRPIDESDGYGGVDSNGGKIKWHCWCVAHRAPEPIPINNKIPKRKDLFPNSSYILEFEPVYDISVQNKKDSIDIIPREGQEINKLYPLSTTYEGDGSSGGDTATIKDKTESGDTVKVNDQNKNTTTDNKNKNINDKTADDEPWSLGNDSYATLDEMRRSTISCSKPLKVLERALRSQRAFHQHQLMANQRAEEKEKDLDDDLKRINRFERERETVSAYIKRNIQNPDGIASMDYVSLLSEVDEQLQVDSLDRLFDVVTGIVKDLINFQRTMVYLFDDNNNGKVVGELVDFRKCRELFRNLYFPSTDIPAQARDLYRRNKVRQLYDRESTTSKIVCRNKDDLLHSLDMSNCFLRALSPIHLKYLENMNAISSVSISIVAFGKLYGLVACHSFFGDKMRVSFPQRQILSMLSDIISRNVERIILSNKNTISIEHESSTNRSFESPSVDPNSMDLLQLFDCVNVFLSIENTERLIGPEDNIETVKYIGNHFKNKGIRDITFTTNIGNDFPDLELKDVNKFSGILYVPLTENNFILFIREGLLSSITWAGNPSYKQLQTGVLEPRNSFKKWTETVQGTSKKWRPEDIENSRMLSIIYGKILSLHQTNDFDEIHKDKRKVVNDLLTTSVGHELKTPLHQHLSYLEMALEGKKLDKETRRNLKKSKISVDNLLYNVNDIIDLIGSTESNNNNQQSVLNEAMDLIECIDEVIELFKNEMASKGITIQVNTVSTPRHITSDRRKIRLIISNLLENAIKFSNNNSRIYLDSSFVPEYENEGTAAVKFVIRDEGLGIRPKRLKEMFKSFETIVETDEVSDDSSIDPKVTFGKGLAQVSRAVSKLNAKMTANSSVGSEKRHSGSTFTVFIPFNTPSQSEVIKLNNTTNTPSDISSCNRRRNFLSEPTSRSASQVRKRSIDDIRKYKDEKYAQNIKVEENISLNISSLKDNVNNDNISRINVLAVDDDPINNKIIKKRLITNKFKVTTANNGQVAIDKLSKNENEFDYILLDLMMPVKDGIDTVRCIRKMKLKRRQCNYDIPVLAFSASITSNDLSQLKEAGFSGFFTKPINFKHLVEMLKNYNERSKYIYETGKIRIPYMSNNHEDHGAEGNNQFIFPMRALFKNNPNQNIHDSDTNSKSNNNTNPSDVDKPWHYANFDRRKSLTSMVSSTTGTDRAEPRGIDRSIHSTNPNIPLPGEANERDFEGYDGPTFQEEAEREMDAAESGMEDLSESGTDNQSTSKVTEKQSEPTRLQPETAAQAMEAHKTKLDNYRHSKVSKEPVIGSPVPTDSTSTDDVSASSLNDENASEELPKTKRFEFCQSEDDYYLITHHHDNKAKLKKCEDEPIATPGAIQSYGCLIVLEEDENGNAVIRQASENTSEIIGCSPSQLFSIPCFTYVLDNNSRLTLRDVMFDLNSESDYDEGDSKSDSSDYKKDKIQVFSISGKGHSDISDQYSDDEGSVESSNNKSWSCWCCIHKPELPKPINKNYPPANEVFVSSLYILELEPVITYKYPPFVDDVSKMPKEMDERDMKPAGSLDLNISEKGPSTGDESTAHASGSSTKKTGTSMSTDTLHAVPTPGGNFHLEDDNENYVGDSHATAEEIRRSTTPLHKDLKTLHRIRRSERAQETRRRVADLLEETAYENENDELKDKRRKAQKRILARQRIRNYIEKPGNLSSLDTIALLGEINDQLSRVDDIDKFMGVAVGIVKDLTRFHRVMMYRFDQQTWDGEVVAELVDWRMCKELFYGLHFPGSDIPAQARDLYKRNKVRQLYDRDLLTSRIVCRNKIDLMYPLDMSNCSLRAMSPVHLQYLKNMRVKASLSISVIAFGQLHGLIACHSFGDNGMRVNFPMFEILKLLSDAISRNIERLAYTRRLQSRKLISTAPSETSPGGYIASTAMDLLTIFEASYGILSIGDSMKVLGDMEKNVSKEIVAIGEFLRLKNFEPMVYTNNISSHFPELQDNIKIIAGLLYIPLSKSGGHDFIAFLRTGQLQEIKWAGNPFRKVTGSLEPRSSFKTWTEKVISISKPWENEQLETASVLGVVYGKFIEIWRQRTELNKANQFSQILISNASHEVRTPLNHIINYIELALDGNLDSETRENLKRSHEASKSLLFTINDLLDLTKVDSGHEVLFNEPINIKLITAEAVNEYHGEAERRDVTLSVECSQAPSHVVSDYRKVNTILKSLLSNAIKYNKPGGFVNVHVAALEKESDNRANVALDIEDNGIGISGSKLEALFRGFEKVDYTKVEESSSDSSQDLVLGLGLASCARAVEQLDGQLKCQSEPKKGTKFSVIIPFNIPDEHDVVESASNSDSSNASDRSFRIRYRHSSKGKSNPSTISSGNESTYIGQQIQRMERSELDSFVDALAPSNQSNFIKDGKSSTSNHSQPDKDSVGSNKSRRSHLRNGDYNVQDSAYPIRAGPLKSSSIPQSELGQSEVTSSYSSKSDAEDLVKGIEELDVSKIDESKTPLKVLYVDDDPINRNILRKRLSRDKMEVDLANNGEDAINVITSKSEYHYDVILMDLLMPILDGWECTKKIRSLESDGKIKSNNSIKNCLPILAVSASISPLDHDKLRDCGFVGFFTKPIDFKILTDLIESLYDHKKWNDNLYDKNSGRSFEKGGFIMAPEK